MKILISLILLVVSPPVFSYTVDIMSFNILHTFYTDNDDNRPSWVVRKSLVFQIIESTSPDVIGFQEDSIEQINDLADRFPQYGHVYFEPSLVGIGKNSIFYKKDMYTVDDSGGFVVSVGRYRRATWVKLREVRSGVPFYVFNTHWAAVGNPSDFSPIHNESVESIAEELALADANTPIILTGDFNTFVTKQPIQYLLNNSGSDSQLSYPMGFRKLTNFNINVFIDYILVSDGTNARDFDSHVLSNATNTVSASDHGAITGRVSIPALIPNSFLPVITDMLLITEPVLSD